MPLIVLSAFNGKLRGDPMEWPDQPPGIDLPLAPASSGDYRLGMDVPQATPTLRKGRFTPTGKHLVLDNGRTAAIYELTGL